MTENAFAPWSESYLVRISSLDEEHKIAFQLLNEMAAAITERREPKELETLFKKLIDHYRKHCENEERLLSTHNYLGLEKQRQDHANWLKELDTLHRRISRGDLHISMDVLTQIRDWFTSHILGADKAYGEFLTDHGVR